jgi:hypothetical protein
MLELIDGINFHELLYATRSDAWKKRREDESLVEWFNRVSIPTNKWLEKFEWHKNNKYWLEASLNISFAVLSFLGENKIKKEDFEDELGFKLDLKGTHNYLLSEIKKIELIIGKRIKL